VVTQRVALDRAYAHCQCVARDHYENFPVASRLLPRSIRPHIAAIYAFARRADDYADEPGLAIADRLRLLDDWESRLKRTVDAGEEIRVHVNGDPPPDDLVFMALGDTIQRCALPPSLFTDLLSAFRQDVTTTRYKTWADLLDYCRRSANPVGRLVLRVAGYHDSALDRSSDAVCTALQLTNFWQDLRVDYERGRLYVPTDDLARAAAQESDLAAGTLTREWTSVMASLIQRTQELFNRGRDVCDGVRGRLKWELRLTWLGGSRVLDRVAEARQRSLVDRPTLRASDVPALLRDALFWKAGRRGTTTASIAG
jgi:hydroxysqualene synthase